MHSFRFRYAKVGKRATVCGHCLCLNFCTLLTPRFRLFTRLFAIMGILWAFEFISWEMGFLNLNPKFQLIFLVTDCLNALQGVWIFVMFVWKPLTWKQLRKKYRKAFRLDSRTSLTGPSTVKSSIKSNTKSGSVSSKTLSPTWMYALNEYDCWISSVKVRMINYFSIFSLAIESLDTIKH